MYFSIICRVTETGLDKVFYFYIKIAQYNLALLYKEGEGTEKNLEKAIHWYHEAAKNGMR